MRVLLAVFGSRGDVHPMLALAQTLVASGHRAIVSGPPDFCADAAEAGVVYVAHGPSAKAVLRQNQNEMGANPLLMVRAVRRDLAQHIDAQFAGLMPLAAEADMLIAASVMWAGSSVAEARGIPYRYVAFAPELLRSRFHGPMLLPWRDLPPVANRVAWASFDKLLDWLMLADINRNRRALGLAELDRLAPHAFPTQNTLLAADPELACWPPDVDAHAPIGALQLATGSSLQPALESFLDAGAPPIYIGFGSMTDPEATATTQLLADVVQAVGCRAVISSGWAGLGAPDLGARILVVGSCAHEKLFPRTAAVIHHGGAGTTHTAARAGVPQLLVPHLLDQFAWARRIHRLGLSPAPIRRDRVTRWVLAEGVRTCLTDGHLRERARAMARRIATRLSA